MDLFESGTQGFLLEAGASLGRFRRRGSTVHGPGHGSGCHIPRQVAMLMQEGPNFIYDPTVGIATLCRSSCITTFEPDTMEGWAAQ